jgi:murein DD-endopeptidase MepM/ murein hydrolase activator NlpD
VAPEFDSEGFEFLWPVEGPVISNFGRRRSGWHAGVDIKAEPGTPVMAAAPGVVYFSGWERAYGRVVKIEHPGGFTTVYAHNLENLVEVGDEVDASTVIATVGRSGRTTGYHLHFEIRREGMAYNPLYLLQPREPASPEIGPVAAGEAIRVDAEGP